MGYVDRFLILLWWSVVTFSSFWVRWSIITFSLSLRSDVSERSGLCKVVIVWLLFVLFDGSLCTAFRGFAHCVKLQYSFHDFNFSLLSLLRMLFLPRSICFYGAPLTTGYFFLWKVFLGSSVFSFDGVFLCPPWVRICFIIFFTFPRIINVFCMTSFWLPEVLDDTLYVACFLSMCC